MPTTTVIDTIHHVIYDTVHTSVFDTVHTVSFDTVKVALDSNYSVQILHEAQQFYSTSFSDIQFMIGILVSIFLAGVGIFFGLNFKWTIERIKKETRLGVEEETKKAIADYNEKLDKCLDDCRKEMGFISEKSKAVTNKMMFAILAQAKITTDANNALRMYLILIKFVDDEFDVIHIPLAEIAVKEMKARFFSSTIYSGINKSLCKSIYDELGSFRRNLYDVNDADVKKFVEEFDPIIISLREELSARF
ncbi:MAG: hypothetical protein IJM92_09385 [Fibrobacter sp.]|uniref:hypothetical protein n=1 Tax=Fibrobacter sp. TaxID=35828 RepID=UPI0025C259C3|nr:hypothetical protein [Fibrobacter sp.]MBQ3716617.1 hypothetical protein [Fibrobacter sp.]MBQ3776627.1 hypothetical protein [Fibrobacter sp.]MBQ7079855.1 hypothetical protein [Fibrobacter sp.]